MPTVGRPRWRALGELLRPDAARWGALGLLLAVQSTLLLAGPFVVRAIVDDSTAGTTAAHVTRLALLFLAIAVIAQGLAVVVAWFATQ